MKVNSRVKVGITIIAFGYAIICFNFINFIAKSKLQRYFVSKRGLISNLPKTRNGGSSSSSSSSSSVKNISSFQGDVLLNESVVVTVSNMYGGVDTICLFDRDICSGIGDRLLAIFSAYTIAILNNKSMVARWCGHAIQDRSYPLEILKTYLDLPAGLTLLVDQEFDSFEKQNPMLQKISYENQELKAFSAYDGVPSLAFKTMTLLGGMHITRTMFEGAYYDWTKQIKQCNAKCALPKSQTYFALHIRQGDKSFEHGSRPFIHGANNPLFCTHEALVLASKTNMSTYFISDDVDLINSEVMSNYDPYGVKKWISVGGLYCELCMMLHSKGIIQHSPLGWSAFSAVAAFAAQIPLLNTWRGSSPDENHPHFHRFYDFDAKGGRPTLAKDCLYLSSPLSDSMF
jgi:hypothetical protein